MHRNREKIALINSVPQSSTNPNLTSLHPRTDTPLKKSMTTTMTRLFFTPFVVFCCLLVPTLALAQDGHVFGGFYNVTGTMAVGEDIAFTLSIELFNYGEEDVNYGTVYLIDPLNTADTYATVTAIYLPGHADTDLTVDATIPAWLYHQWKQGAGPHLVIDFQDSTGNQIRREIELSREFIEEVSL